MAVAIPDTKSHVPVPKQARGWRRAFHTLLTVAGWAVFAYWWWIVVHRVSASEVRFTALFIGVSLVTCVTVTGLWVLYNVSIFRRKGPRNNVRPARLDYSYDPLGRKVTNEASAAKLLEARVVRITLDQTTKTYRPMRPDGPNRAGSSRD